MTSMKFASLAARIERFPIAGSFTISRGAKTEAATVMAEVSRDGKVVGRLQEAQEIAHRCFVQNHDGLLAQAQKAAP